MAMNIENFKLNSKIIIIGLVSFVIYSCSNSQTTENENEVTDTDTVKALGINVGGQLFSIPSPMQTALLIQKLGISYDKTMLNDGSKNGQYISDYSKALNLGIYGADLGYVSLYSQTQDALVYLDAVKNLADKIGVSAAFNQATMKRINDNISNKDSMLALVGVAYRASDAYLKTNKRTEISSLILTGGWIESMHFSIAAYNYKPNDELKYRIAEQKQALGNIIKLINSHNLPDANMLVKDLEEIAKVYEEVISKYIFVEPTTDESKKLTYINSVTEISISKEQINLIAAKILAIRNNIINAKS